MLKKQLWIIGLLLLSGCAVYQASRLNDQFGHSSPDNRQPHAIKEEVSYWQDIKPLMDKRCVVCHGCYDAPCQLKMESVKGIERGASKNKVYTKRLLEAEPSDLFDYNYSVTEWRGNEFFPVLNERQQKPEANRASGLIYQMLKLKQDNPVDPDDIYLHPSIDVSLKRKQECPTIEEFPSFASDYPQWGMPFGLPALNEKENWLLMSWLEQGANYSPQYEKNELLQNPVIEKWESFLNGASLKRQLVSRYIYEHIYLANIYFPSSDRQYYRLVRSRTVPGEPLDKIATRRPYDDPGSQPFYYRFEKYDATIVAKNHMPYLLDDNRMERWKDLFYETDYKVTMLPNYNMETASNPFATFWELPAISRYQFMLDEAQFTIMGYIKGPVCRGQIALNVINDHFWVFFENPDEERFYHYEKFLANQSHHLQLPARTGSNNFSVIDWIYLSAQQKAYLHEHAQYFRSLENQGLRILDENLVWSGGPSHNPNAALTIFRHNDSASVEKGLVGAEPQTAWLITYPLLERIHYLLVAGFDVYGNIGHLLETRLYMDFLRMEGEANFIELLPVSERKKIHELWYRDARERVKEYIYSENFVSTRETAIDYQTDNRLFELYEILNAHLGDAKTTQFSLDKNHSDTNALNQLQGFNSNTLHILPQMMLIMVEDADSGEQNIYSLINNSAHSNLSHLFNEQDRRIYKEDTLTITNGVLGSYPNALFKVSSEKLQLFVKSIQQVSSEQDYKMLRDKYGIRRVDSRFWVYSDKLHEAYQAGQQLEYGLLDYNRLENR